VAEARPTRAAAPARSRVKLSHGMEVEDEDGQPGGLTIVGVPLEFPDSSLASVPSREVVES